jgi:hypothetical protein
MKLYTSWATPQQSTKLLRYFRSKFEIVHHTKKGNGYWQFNLFEVDRQKNEDSPKLADPKTQVS